MNKIEDIIEARVEARIAEVIEAAVERRLRALLGADDKPAPETTPDRKKSSAGAATAPGGDNVRAGVRWTPREDTILRRDYAAGVAVEDIAATIGRSRSSIPQRASFLGLRRPGSTRKPRTRKALQPGEMEKIDRMHSKGASAREIARAIRRAHTTVAAYIRKRGES